MDRGSLRAFFFMERKDEYITFSMDKKDEYLRLINFKSKLAVSSAGADNSVVQTKAALTRDSGLIKMVPVKMVGTADTGLRDAKAAFHKAGIDLEDARAGRNKASVLQRDLATRQVELDTARNDLALKTGAAQGATDLTVAMPLLVLDRTGLSCAGALLAFARCTDAPVLLDSATGNVVLYFHGVNDQFFAAYLDTFVIPSTQELPVDGSAVLFTARDAGLDLGALTITVSDGDAPGRCDLTISGGREGETWRSLLTGPGPPGRQRRDRRVRIRRLCPVTARPRRFRRRPDRSSGPPALAGLSGWRGVRRPMTLRLLRIPHRPAQ